MELSEIRSIFARSAKVREKDVILEFSPDYPECLQVVVLRDVDPQRVHDAIDSLASSGACRRAVVNIVEKRDADGLRSEAESTGARGAIRKSWDVNVATIRWG